jgi:hypothetical protein
MMIRILFALFALFPAAASVRAETFDAGAGHEMKRIAYSSKAGVEIFAETTGGVWCEDILELKIFAHDETAFDVPLLTKLMSKVGLVLEKECPAARQAILDGYNNNTLVYQGAAARDDGWKPEKGTLKVKIRQLQAAAARLSAGDDFSVEQWTPPSGRQKIIARVDSRTALEHRIYSKDRRCSILYTTDMPAERIKKWSIRVENNSCSENLVYGRAKVSIINEKGRVDSVADGYFTEGRFTGGRNLNMVLLNRYGYNKNLQNLSYLIESDPELKIHYLGYMKSTLNSRSGRYSAWQVCNPFTIAAVTENEELFLESAVTDNILRTAQSYADIFCPGTKKMKFFATRVPQGLPGMDQPETPKKEESDDDPRLIYTAVLERKSGGKWRFTSDRAQNLARLRELARRNEEAREHQLMMADYNELIKSDYLGRLAYMHGTDRVDNATAALVLSSLLKKPVPVSILVRLSALGRNKAWADWPLPLEIRGTNDLLNRTGWHIVSGDLSPLSDADRKERGIPAEDFAGTLDLTAATACEEEGCGEVSDIVNLVRRRHDRPVWLPYHAPYREGAGK